MSSSRLRNTLSLFQKPKPRWPDPEQSIGKLRGMKKGKYNCWEAEGPAKLIFEQVKPSITELLESACVPVPSSSFVMFDIFMIGETRETALPHIMFSCKRRESRKIALDAIKKSNILDQCPPGIHLGDWDYPPHIKNLQFLSSSYYTTPDIYGNQGSELLHYSYDNRFISIPNPNTLGMDQALQLVLPDGPEYFRTATIGSIIALSGRHFYLAPAHVYYPRRDISLEKEPDVSSVTEDSECEFGGFDEEGEDLSDVHEVEFMSQYSLTPESSDEQYDRHLDEDGSTSEAESDCLTSALRVERQSHTTFAADDSAYYVPDHVENHASPPSPCPEDAFTFLKSGDLDYCLIDVDENEHHLSVLPVLSPENTAILSSGSTNVTAVTGSGNLLTGVLSSRLSCIRLPNAARYINVLSVQFEEYLQPGDSGSIVRDSSTGMIYGHIVAGDTISQTAIIIPAFDVLNDIMAKYIQTNTSTLKRGYETFTNETDLAMTSNGNEEMFVEPLRRMRNSLENAEHHIAMHAHSVGRFEGHFPGIQTPGRTEIAPNAIRGFETMSQAWPSVAGSIYETDSAVDLESNHPLTMESLGQQRPNAKDEDLESVINQLGNTCRNLKSGQACSSDEVSQAMRNIEKLRSLFPTNLPTPPTSSTGSSQRDRECYRCWLCDPRRGNMASFQTFGALKRHLSRHGINENQWRCAEAGCYTILHRRDRMHDHLIHRHQGQDTPPGDVEGTRVHLPPPTNCPICDCVTSSWSVYWGHIKDHCLIVPRLGNPSASSDQQQRRSGWDQSRIIPSGGAHT